jgi:RNA polymerase-binding transcription factor DksA
MLTDDLRAELRATLEADRDQLRRQIDDLPTEDDFDENHADSGQVAAEQGESRVLAGALGDQLAEIEHALAKIDEGTYGLCEADGEPIPEGRLEAMPATRFCIDHA